MEEEAGEGGGPERATRAPEEPKQEIKGSGLRLGHILLVAVMARLGDQLRGGPFIHSASVVPPPGARSCIIVGLWGEGCSGLDGGQDGGKV